MLIKTLIRFRYFFLLISLIIPLNSYSQKNNTTTVVFKYIKDSFMLDSFSFDIGKPLQLHSFENSTLFPKKIVSFTQKGDTCETKCEYTIKDTTCAVLMDGFGHEIIIIPGDFITINISPKNSKDLAGKYVKEWFHETAYSGKNKYIYSLFDFLSNSEGDLRLGSNVVFSRNDSTLNFFCNEVKRRYLRRLEFLTDYSHKNSIPLNIQELAKSEIYSTYINNLIVPLFSQKFNITSYPTEFSNLIKNNKPNNKELYFKTTQYHTLAYELSRLNNNEFLQIPSFTIDQLLSTYKWIKENYKGRMRDHQITLHLEQYINRYATYAKQVDSLFKDFKTYSKNQNYIHFLDSVINVNKSKKLINYTIDQAMASVVKDSINNKLTILSLLNKNPVILICWASWCKPCLAEIPYEIQLEKEYGDKIDFIYLSFDKISSQWRSKSEDSKINKNNYLLQNNFKSDLAMYYKISSIPQYLIYNKQGKLVENKSLRPSDKKFRAILNELIN